MELDKMEYLVIALLIILIFKEDIVKLVSDLRENKTEPDEAEQIKQEKYKKEFDKMMDYSVEDAIQSKRGDIDG